MPDVLAHLRRLTPRPTARSGRGAEGVRRLRNLRLAGLVVLTFVVPAAAACTRTEALRSSRSPSEKPGYCAEAQRDALQLITGSPASPYFVHHPSAELSRVPTVMFLPSGSGHRRNAQRMWDSYLRDGKGVDSFRIVIPYSVDLDFLDEFPRTLDVLDEVLACYGGDPGNVHLAGVSNGGLAAFVLMLEHPDRFATLLGAPGEFPTMTPAEWAKPLAGKSVFNGVGERDTNWKPEVRETHDGLVSVGIDSTYFEFPGQGHVAGEGLDKGVLFEFWTRRSGR